MLRSMLSAASAIRNHQTFMDVVANNIANVNTVGYKSARASFHELLSQTMSPGSAPTNQRGGINPIQVGLGMSIGSVDNIFSQGPVQATGRSNDLALDGNGFFIFQGANQNLYSRDGSLDLALDGSLINIATGMRVMGWQADAAGNVNTAGALGAVTIPLNQGLAQATQNVQISGNLNAQLAARSVSSPQTVTGTVTAFATSNTVAAGQTELPTGDYYVEIQQTGGNTQFRMVDAQGNAVAISDGSGGFTNAWQTTAVGARTLDTGRGLTISFGAGTGTPPAYTTGVRGAGAANVHYAAQSITQQVQVYDSLGAQHTVTLSFTKDTATPNHWTWQATAGDAAITGINPTTGSPIAFTNSGQYDPTNPTATLALTFNNGAANQTMTLNMAGLTQLAQPTDLAVPVQDGYAPGRLTGYDIGTDGTVTGVYANGLHRVVAQLALASFANPGGLLRSGDNMYAQWTNSGPANVGAAGANGRGAIRSGFLESANVDLAQQFTSMITAQRGFQANSRVISASDQMLQDLVNLVR